MNEMPSFNILIVGDVMLDCYVIGKHTRQSPEADVPILLTSKETNSLGGAGNVALNLQSLGATPILVTAIADDDAGQKITSLLETENIAYQIVKDNSRCTTIKKRFVTEDYSQLLRVDTESTDAVSSEVEIKLINSIRGFIDNQKIDGIIIQDYNKGIITENLIKALQDIRISHSIPLFVDPKHDNFELLSRCDVFKPNLSEARLFFGEDTLTRIDDIEAFNIATNRLIHTDKLFITLAEKGIFYKNKHESGWISGVKVENPDVSGAGDTVIAVLAVFFLMGYSIEQMAYYANKAGALSCKWKGIAKPNFDQIVQENPIF
jgi:rfaE bifunctional protein kinase chain/domain